MPEAQRSNGFAEAFKALSHEQREKLKARALNASRTLRAHGYSEDDLYQEVWARCLHARTEITTPGQAYAYFLGTLLWVTTDFGRQVQRHKRNEQAWIDTSTSIAMDHREELILRDSFRKLYARLNEIERMVLEGRLAGLTPEEVQAKHSLTSTQFDSAERQVLRKRLKLCLED